MRKNKKSKQGLSRLLELADERTSKLTLSILCSIAGTLCQLLPFWAAYQVMAELLQHAASGAALHANFMFRWAFYGLIGLLVGYILTYIGGMMAHTFAYRVICRVRLKVAEHLGRLPMGYISTHSVGKVKQILEANIEQIEVFLAHQLPDVISTLVMFLALLIIMLTQNTLLAFACLIPIIIGFACQLIIMIRIVKSGGVKANFDALEKISSSSIQYVNGMPSIKIFGQTVKSFHKFYDEIMDYCHFATHMTEMIRPGFVLFRLFVLSLPTFIIPVGLSLYLKDPNDVAFVATLLFFLIIGPGAAAPILKLRGFAENMNVISEGINRVNDLLNEPLLEEPLENKLPTNYDIQFKDVSFSYEQDGRKVIDTMSFTAKQGQVTALVGPSGAGKSTLAELILRFWDVTDGAIKIGGINIKEIPTQDLMRHISFVFQDNFLFSDSIYNNIALGKPQAKQEEVEKAAKIAQCHDFIMSLPNGYDTKLGTKGVYLSGGEKQRIAIARALLKDAPILILDEASAYADAENEYKMQLALSELIKDKTVIIIAHRLKTICNANQIIVIQNGRIAEYGTHESLCQAERLYASMWEASIHSSTWTIDNRKDAITL